MNCTLNSELAGCLVGAAGRVIQSKGAVVSVPRLGACLGKGGLRAGGLATAGSVAASACAS